MSDGHALSDANPAADRERDSYRLLVGILIILDAAMGLALLVSPRGVTRLLLLGEVAATDWARIAGLLALIAAAFLWTGRRWPERAQGVNMVGIIGRFALAVVLMLAGGRLLWVGLIEAIAALVLLRFYYRLFAALVMIRP
jgi:hypothetical protein